MPSRRCTLLEFARIALLCTAFCAVLLGSAGAAEPSAKDIDEVALLQFPKDPHSGFSLAIAHRGRIVYSKGYGFRDSGRSDHFLANDENFYGMPLPRSSGQRAVPDGNTIYQIGSVTKQFTAAAILLLDESGKLKLDDPVSRYVPEFAGNNLTLRMLLTQRSGLPDLNTLTFLQRVRPLAKANGGAIDERRVSREIAALPPDFPPGTRFEYSNSNYYVLGTVVERVAGQSLGDFLNARIFVPFGLTRTGFARTVAGDDVAIGYRTDDKGNVYRAYPWDLAWLGGSGAMTSTVDDLARWDIALLEHRVLTAASLAQLWHGEDAGRGQGTYAMGWIGDAIGSHRYLWHNGEVGGFHSLNVIFPNDDLAFAILTNNQDAKPEFLLPGIAALYFPVSGIDRILPHSGVVLVEASLAVGLGALAIAVVALFTLKRFIFPGAMLALLALIIGFFSPSIIGFVWAGVAALVPTAAYVAAARLIPKTKPAPGVRSRG